MGEWWEAWLGHGTLELDMRGKRGDGKWVRHACNRLSAVVLTARPQVADPHHTPPCLVAPLPPPA